MIARRDFLRTGSLATLAVVGAGVWSACGGPSAGNGGGSGGASGSAADLKLVASDVQRSAADPTAVQGGVASVQAVGAAVYATLAQHDGNLALSPYSAAAVLGMAATGAGGRTLSEMLGVLAASSATSLNLGLAAVTQYVDGLAGPVPGVKGAGIELAAANQVFGQSGERWRTAFLDALARSYGAGVREVDFENNSDGARAAINDWAAAQTHDRIKEVIPSGVLTAMTRLVLVDALYLKASWQQPFQTAQTTDDDFHLADGSTVQAPTMHGSQRALGAGDGWRSAQLPYGNNLAMTIVLPDEGRAADLNALVTAGRLGELLVVDAGSGDLALPRWTFTTAAALGPALEAAGMTTAFTDAADFTAMTDQDRLSLSAVLQQVFVAVDEAGTEAAAVTAGVATSTALQGNPPEPLVVDRPFLFVIHDTEHGVPLFLGRVADPRS